MQIINSSKMPAAAGHYSTCVEHNGLLYVSGQLPKDSEGRIPEGIDAQTELVLDKLNLILKAANSSLNQVLQVRIYIVDVELWGGVNTIYAKYFSQHLPARCVVPVPALHYGCLLELECTAFTTSA